MIEDTPPGLSESTESPQVNAVKPRQYRQNRKLGHAEKAELIELYEAGSTMAELAKIFECHRHSVMRQQQREGIAPRPQRKMTPELVSLATNLYHSGRTLREVGELLGLEASTVGKGLKRECVRLRPPVVARRDR